MLGLNESSSMEEWLAALCKVDDLADFMQKNPDFREKCPWKELWSIYPLEFPQLGPPRANLVFWFGIGEKHPELLDYFDWKEGLKQLETLIANRDKQPLVGDLLCLSFGVFSFGVSEKAFACSSRQWKFLEKRVQELAHECISADLYISMFMPDFISSEDFLALYTRHSDNYDRCDGSEIVKTLCEKDWRTLLEQKPDFCKENHLSPDGIALEAVESQDLKLLQSAAGMGADLCSEELLFLAFFPEEGCRSMPIVRYLMEEKKIHEKMMASDDEEKRSCIFRCIQSLAAEGKTQDAEYLIDLLGKSKEAVRAGLTGAAQGLQGSTFLDLWNEHREMAKSDQKFRNDIFREVFASQTNQERFWRVVSLLNSLDFHLNESDLKPVVTDVLKSTQEVMDYLCGKQSSFGRGPDAQENDNADALEIAKTIVKTAEELK